MLQEILQFKPLQIDHFKEKGIIWKLSTKTPFDTSHCLLQKQWPSFILSVAFAAVKDSNFLVRF